MSPDPAADAPLGARLAALTARVRDFAQAREARSPGARVRLARPLEGPPAAAKLESLLSLAPNYVGGAEPKAPYAPSLTDFREQISGCLRCPLGPKRKALVFGEGRPGAPLAFVGLAPGFEEESEGSPLAGAAGELFDRILGAMGFKRDGVYVCNVLKCRSHGPAGPEPAALEACRPYLEHQIALARPKVVVALGEGAARFLSGSREPLSALRGKWGAAWGLKLMPTYHPRDLLRDEGLKRHVWEDLKQVLKAIQTA